MDEQRSWQERYGVADWEERHWCSAIGIAFIVASPFFALARAEAGLLAFLVGFLAFALACVATPDDDEKTDK